MRPICRALWGKYKVDIELCRQSETKPHANQECYRILFNRPSERIFVSLTCLFFLCALSVYLQSFASREMDTCSLIYKAQYTPPTPMRLNTVELSCVGRCVLIRRQSRVNSAANSTGQILNNVQFSIKYSFTKSVIS